MKAIDEDGHTWEINRQPPGVSRILNRPDFDLLEVANSLFDCETLVHQGESITKVEIPLYQEYDASLSNQLEELFALTLERQVEIGTVENPQTRFFPVPGLSLKEGYTCLFSGGIDSYSTLLRASEKFGSITGCFVDHRGFHKMRGVYNRLDAHLRSHADIILRSIPASQHGSFLRRSRGAYYAFLGLLLGRQNLIVGEAGATMYQPKLTVLDEVTITAYPGLLRKVGDVAGLIIGKRPNIIIPCEDMTKAEVISSCPDPDWVKRTFSCSSTTRYATDIGVGHCGSCFACIVRRMSVLVCGIDDRGYASDITGPLPSEWALDNFVQLLRFSIDYLVDKNTLAWCTREIIESNHKEDLFERFSEDNLAGLLLLAGSSKTGPVVSRMRDVSKHWVDDSDLKERIAEVRSRETLMDFSRMI